MASTKGRKATSKGRVTRKSPKRKEQRSALDLTSLGGLINLALGQIPSDAGVQVNPYFALTYGPYFRCVDLISSKVAGLDLCGYRRLASGGRDRDTSIPAEWLLNGQANDHVSAYQFRKTLTEFALNWGNGFAYIQRQGRFGPPIALHVLNPQSVTVQYNYGEDLLYRIRLPNGDNLDALPVDVLHIRSLTWNAISGYPTWLLMRNTIGLGKATEVFGSAFFRRGATSVGTLEYPRHLSDKAVRNVTEDFEKWQGLENASSVMPLMDGVKFRPSTIPPEAAQFLQTRAFTAKEVGVFFGCPAHFLGDTSPSEANLEVLHQSLLDDCLQPWLKMWEVECQSKLLTDAEYRSRNVFFEHDVSKLVYMDAKKRSEMFQILLQFQVVTPNEVRDQIGMPPIEGGDKPYVPAQKVDLKKQPGGADPTDTAEPAPPEPDAQPADRARLVAAYRSLTEATAERLLRRLAHSIPRAAKKPDQFLKLVGEVLSEQATVMHAAVSPLVEAADALGFRSKDTTDDLLALVNQELLELSGACVANDLGNSVDTWVQGLQQRHAPLLVTALIGE
jgi:HK97 family phage portal protein